MIDYSKLRMALGHLDAQWLNHEASASRSSISSLDREAIQESVIKRLDLAIEMTWKHLMRYLGEEVGLADLPAGPKPILRAADQASVLPGSIDDWIEYVNARNASSHDYSGEKAQATLKVIPGFLRDAKALYEAMAKERWDA